MAAIATLSPLVYSLYLTIEDGLCASIPLWLLVISILGAFSFGFLMRNRGFFSIKNIDQTQKKTHTSTIDFAYEPPEPHNQGWKLSRRAFSRANLQLFSLQDGKFGKVLRIQGSFDSYMDYLITHKIFPDLSKLQFIRFFLKPGDKWSVYVKTTVKSESGNSKKTVWFQPRIGDQVPERIGNDFIEWAIYVQHNNEMNDWISIELDIPKAIRETIGKQGWQYYETIGIRLRGAMDIAKIELCE